MTLPRAGGTPALSGVLRARPEDFQVTERLSFTPTGTGEHLYLWIEKAGANTGWVAAQLARCAGLRPRDVGYAGRKDRHAVTRQWLSLHLPGRDDPDVSQWEIDGVRVLETTRHGRKLRTGSIAANEFVVRVTGLQGADPSLDRRVADLRRDGAPNYFGPQRFGRDDGNLDLARRLFDGARLPRDKRSLALSAARAWLFNGVLARRIDEATWHTALPGDCLNLDGSRSFFACSMPDEQTLARVAAGDLHPTGPLWGSGELPSQGRVAALERDVAASSGRYAAGLERAGLRHERRALRVMPRELEVVVSDTTLTARFALPAGAFATTVLAELVSF